MDFCLSFKKLKYFKVAQSRTLEINKKNIKPRRLDKKNLDRFKKNKDEMNLR